MPGANAVSFLKDYQPKKHSKDEGRHAIQAVNSNIVNQNSIWRQHIGKEEKMHALSLTLLCGCPSVTCHAVTL